MSSESDFGSHNYDFSISAALFLVFSSCVLCIIVRRGRDFIPKQVASCQRLSPNWPRDFGMSDDTVIHAGFPNTDL